MNKTFTLFIFLIFTLPLFGQTDSSKIAFIAYWSKGDSYDFKVTKVKKRWTNDKLTKNDSTQYITNFKVIDSTEKSYTLQWSFKNFLTNSHRENLNKLFDNKQAVNDIVKNYGVTKVIYKTDEYGSFLEIINWKEISILMGNMLKELEESIKIRKPEKANDVEQAMAPFVKIYSSKEGIEQLVFYELQYFHFPFGIEYDTNKPLEYEQELPSMVGGEPIKADAKLSIFETNLENLYCVLKEEAIINPAETKRQVTLLFKKMGIDEKKAEEIMKTALLKISDLNYYQYYFNPGIPLRIYGNRKTLLDIDKTKVKNIDELIIELINDK